VRAVARELLAFALVANGAGRASADPPPAGESLEIHDPQDEPALTVAAPAAPLAAPSAPLASFGGVAWAELASDTRLDNAREAAGGLRAGGTFKLEVWPSSSLRAVSEVRLRYDVAVERNESHAPFVLVNGRNARTFFEAMPGDCFVDLEAAHSPRLRLAAGLMTFAWGQTDFGSPADPINPRDLRWGPSVEPAALKVPVPALAANLDLDAAHVDLVWQPFFTPMRAWFSGHDYALLSPGGGQLPADVSGLLPHVLDDALQSGALGGFGPAPGLASSSVAARVTGRLVGVDLGLGYRFGWDPVPALTLDPELAQVIVEAASPKPRLLTISTGLAALAPRIAAGERLVAGEHERQHQVLFESGAPLGPLVWKVDAAWSSEQTFYATAHGDPLYAVRHAMVAVAAGVDARAGDRWFATAQLTTLHLFDVPPNEDLLLVAPTLHEVAVALRGVLIPQRLEARVMALWGLTQGDGWVQPVLTWRPASAWSLSLGLSLWQGSRGLGGFFGHTDEVFVRGRAVF
jgi:hypothetical protein